MCSSDLLGMLRQRNRANFKVDGFACQRGVARLAGGVFGAFAVGVFGINLHHVQRNIDAGAGRLAVPHKIISSSLQAMVNMNRCHLPLPLRSSDMQQGGRIRTAAVGHGYFLGVRK